MDELHDEWAASCISSTRRKRVQEARPILVSAIAIGNEVYLGSSIKGNQASILITHDNQKLVQALQVCRMSYGTNKVQGELPDDRLHRSRASCGELVASSMYLIRHGELPWDHQAPNGRKPIVVSYGRSGHVKTPTIGLVDPCSSPIENKDIGCKQFAGLLNWETTNEMPEAEIKEVNEAPTGYHPTSLAQGWSVQSTADIDPISTS
jgi:hypothetical protein